MRPQLSLVLVNWTADVPDDWHYLVDRAQAAEAAGIDRVVVSDHVVFGENMTREHVNTPELQEALRKAFVLRLHQNRA